MINWARIKEHVQKVDFWSPNKEIPDEHFEYVDISSINRLHKCIDHNVVPKLLGRDAPSRARQKINIEDVLVSTVRPNLNSIALTDNEFINGTTSTGFCVLRAKSTLNPKYLFYWVQTNAFVEDMTKKASGASYPAVSDKIIKESKIPLPPLETQKKIAEILDAANTLRQKTKTLIKKYNQLTQSLFLEMFGDPIVNEKGWEEVEMKVLCSFKRKSIKPTDIRKGTNYVGLENIEKQSGKILEVIKVENGDLLSNKFWFDESYILYGKLRPYLNKVGLPNFSGICSTDIIPIKPFSERTNKYFIVTLMKTQGFVSFATERSSGANLPRISPNELEKYPIINPPLPLQNQFAERVQAIEVQKAKAQASLENSE